MDRSRFIQVAEGAYTLHIQNSTGSLGLSGGLNRPVKGKYTELYTEIHTELSQLVAMDHELEDLEEMTSWQRRSSI